MIQNILNKYKKSVFNLLKCSIIFSLFYTQTYTQQERMIYIKSGDLTAYVDMYRGNFSIFDTSQSNLDYASLLFGGTTAPSSFFKLYVDDKAQTLDQMKTVYPLGVAVGSQIDGIFQAGDQQDVRVEIVFFSMDLLGNSDNNTLGIVVRLSNTSVNSPRKIEAQFLLDSDVGESRNDPLVYLPTGEKIKNSFIFGKGNIPPFLFFGKKNIAEQRPQGEGFYLYPFVSEAIPSGIVVANWRKINEQSQNIKSINPSLSYNRDSGKDVGVTVCFGAYYLEPNKSTNIGIVLSKNYSPLWPVIDEQVISEGVFNENKFEIESLLTDPYSRKLPTNINELLDNDSIQDTLSDPSQQNAQAKRILYRKKQLGLLEDTEDLEKEKTELTEKEGPIANEDIWSYLYRINWKLKNTEDSIENVLKQDKEDSYQGSPKNEGIMKDNFY